MQTRLTTAFGIQHPIVCGPMALITGGRLAAAVSRAGGLGIIGGGYAGILGGEPDITQELAHVHRQKFGIGFITWALARAPRVLDEVLGHPPYWERYRTLVATAISHQFTARHSGNIHARDSKPVTG